MQAQFDVIDRARKILRNREFDRKPETIADYKATMKRIVAKAYKVGKPDIENYIAVAKDTKSASTWFKRKTAITFGLTEMMAVLVSDQDPVQRDLRAAKVPWDDPRWREWERAIARIERTVQWLERLEAEPAPDQKTRQKRHSKRKDIGAFPKEWRETAVERMPNYRLAVLTSIVTGCRPAELVKGVNLSIEDGSLVAEIIGAKVSEKTGQPLRKLFGVLMLHLP